MIEYYVMICYGYIQITSRPQRIIPAIIAKLEEKDVIGRRIEMKDTINKKFNFLGIIKYIFLKKGTLQNITCNIAYFNGIYVSVRFLTIPYFDEIS